MQITMERRTLYRCLGIGVFVLLVVIVVTLLFVFLYRDTNLEIIRAGPKLVIDHDGGADDAMAIFMALLYERYYDGPTIVGFTTNMGNVAEEQVYVNTQRFLDIAQRRDIPIYRGSTNALVLDHPTDHFFGIDGLGDLDNVVYEPTEAQPGHAANALIEMSKKFEGELTVLAIGPSTNIALAIKLDPEFISRLAHLYISAGNIYSEAHPEPEFNALLDVEAYYVVAEKAVPDIVTFIPFSPFKDRHNITMDWRLNVLGAIDTPMMKALNDFQRISNSDREIFGDLDPKAIGMVLDNSLIEENRCSNNTIILCGDMRGINMNNYSDCNNSNVIIALPASEEIFKTFFYDVFSAELNLS